MFGSSQKIWSHLIIEGTLFNIQRMVKTFFVMTVHGFERLP